MVPVIGHIDIDYFYAQVEEVDDPTLKERPVIVCVFSGRTENSGVVSTANYKAREFGVHSGMPIALAEKKLLGSDPAVVRMDHEKYEVVSNRIMEVVSAKVDILEPTGIDEAFFDITKSTNGDYEEARKVAQGIKESIFETERLTSSVGLGRSKAVAKLGSDTAKPGGMAVVLPDSTEAFLNPLPVTKLYGVGPKTASALEELKVKTIGDLAVADPSNMERLFGRNLGAYLLAAARGNDSDPVRANLEPTQFSRIVTLKSDTRDTKALIDQLSGAIESVHKKLTETKKSFRTLTAIGILTDLSTKTKSKTFESPVFDLATIHESTVALFEELSGSVQKDFRRAGLRVSGLDRVENQKSLSEFIQPTG